MEDKMVSLLMADEFVNDAPYLYRNDSSCIVLLTAVASSMIRQQRIKILNYVETTIARYHLDDFRRFFRVSRGTFEQLHTHMLMYEAVVPTGNGGRDVITVEKHLLIVLWFLATQDTLHNIADRFNVTESSVVRCRTRVYDVFINYLKSKFIVWPQGEELQRVMDTFYEKRNFPQIVGAIDGSHIEIKAPKRHSQTYVNRKGFYSIVLQGVCRDDMRFIHCMAGWQGSCHDARVLQNSDLWPIGSQLCGNGHILGDAAYPLQKWLLTPYRDNGHLTQMQKKYNYMHSSARVVVERAFALLKGRFRRLHHIDSQEIKTAVDTIVVSCVVHKICIINEDDLEDFILEAPIPNIHPLILPQQNDMEGARKRDIVARNLP